MYMKLHLCRGKPHNIHMKSDHLCCQFPAQVECVQSRTLIKLENQVNETAKINKLNNTQVGRSS